jgi:hypothetical protein
MATVALVNENPTTYCPAPTADEIAARAHEMYLARGAEDGHDLDDWLRAEAELRSTPF